MSCSFTQKVSSLIDGELAPAEAREVDLVGREIADRAGIDQFPRFHAERRTPHHAVATSRDDVVAGERLIDDR